MFTMIVIYVDGSLDVALLKMMEVIPRIHWEKESDGISSIKVTYKHKVVYTWDYCKRA